MGLVLVELLAAVHECVHVSNVEISGHTGSIGMDCEGPAMPGAPAAVGRREN